MQFGVLPVYFNGVEAKLAYVLVPFGLMNYLRGYSY
jgi:hypothetical protein